ncbi:MAG: 3-deoxy-manno-octulosonate cytidylyltransferase [Limnobacter sp.]|nr:3-deoxy-manno-octulosonate cytidylyltransferase [Limnobacter sp.]
MFKAVIPARFASTRLPGKPLADIAGKPMVVRVAERALLSKADEVIVATDHEDILKACAAHGIKAMMTRSDWPTGTDRIAEVAAKQAWADGQVVVNVQGDEPLIDPEVINQVALALLQGDQAISTCAHPIHDWADFMNPNVVKIALQENGNALYFSRAPIPYPRDTLAGQSAQQILELPLKPTGFRHVGLYAYRTHFLRHYQNLPPAQIEQLESLEQLRALAHGFQIKVCMIQDAPAAGVDTPEDLERVRAHFMHRE